DDVARPGGSRERVPGEAGRPVMEMNAQRGGEAGDLATPLLRDAHRADDQRGPDVASVLSLRDERRDRLHRLAEAHVVGEDPAGPEVAGQPEPAVPGLLERQEVGGDG